LSYDGTLSVALLADEAVTDFPVMAAGVRSAFDTYRSQGGVTPHQAAPGLSDTGGQHADPPPSVRAGLPAQPESDLIPQATGQTPGEW
jgi:hypothetical protein